jgi:hypothetical protein
MSKEQNKEVKTTTPPAAPVPNVTVVTGQGQSTNEDEGSTRTVYWS